MKIKKKRIALDLDHKDEVTKIGKALTSPIRLEILQLLIEKPSNISEIASTFHIPLSSAALHVKVLQEAKMISVSEQPGVHGAQKMCGIAFEDIYFNAFRHKSKQINFKTYQYAMPIGNYYNCEEAGNCGIVSEHAYLGVEDAPSAFYAANRQEAQLIWFTTGFLEYRFPTYLLRKGTVIEISFSFEICSEAPGYLNDWPSDITVWINGKEIATIYSAGDFGGRRGRLNPAWWGDTATQYGLLHNIAINDQGCFEDAVKCSEETLDTLSILTGKFVGLQIGVKPDAKNVGGMNLFGEKFGDYGQGIIMSVKVGSSGSFPAE